MGILRIGIVEDDLNYRKMVVKQLRRLPYDVRIFEYGCGSDFIKSDAHFELLILDIVLPDIDGIALSKQIRTKVDSIIFLTSTSDRIQEAFGINVAAYIIKDLDEDALYNRLELICRELNTSASLRVRTKSCAMNIPLDDIYKISHESRKIFLYTERKKLQILGETLLSIEPRLSNSFVRANRSSIVNMRHVFTVENGDHVVMDNNSDEYLSRNERHHFLESIVRSANNS
ncbi:MAG: response regulator [Solobacterium sp.]|jgi:DNA-binding LytR/AlgR family response regulator|nr:response regulator [Solobacterium sp.]MCH4221906.1 response regulator [Solobacterium sp.]MCH4265219.1 response regulator [Solobacterium sp.]